MANSKPIPRKITRLSLGGGFTCIKCGIGHYDGYAPNTTKDGKWKAAVLTTPCTHCGFQAPSSMSIKKFHAVIRKRDKDPIFQANIKRWVEERMKKFKEDKEKNFT